jgi:hypothetical protein
VYVRERERGEREREKESERRHLVSLPMFSSQAATREVNFSGSTTPLTP